ncbi:hypothetical protein [Streptomyces sp. MK37H]|uniref:hypothetical protein n=1 Tax=Streptomyces sp. MK37H TaxID=2699117 RepID=UPI001B398F26|nr:hypothetical protein [Streptomyces sp. MK37H]MBP8538846.1 hypothetical protein [Streptomyces sp. MK37H]
MGHDCRGFQRFAILPIGTVVTVTGPRGTFRYRVYAHHVIPGRGAPAHGLYRGDLTFSPASDPTPGSATSAGAEPAPAPSLIAVGDGDGLGC